MTRVEISSAAMRDVVVIDQWWRKHRLASPDAFRDDLEWLARLLAENALLGRRIAVRGQRHVRRALLPRTLHHAYYAVHGQNAGVVVLRIWSAHRRRRPRL